MKVIVDIPEDLIEDIRRAVHEGEYESTIEFVEMALEHQAQIELSQDPSGDSIPALGELIETGQSDLGEEHRNNSPRTKDEFWSNLVDYSSIPTLDFPANNKIGTGILWGQYNRLLPVKFVLRLLANEVLNAGQPVPLKNFSEKTAQRAREFGNELQRLDEELGFGRGEKRSSGFPVGSEADKSRRRFQNHFIGDVGENGSLRGAPFQLGLINVSDDGKQQSVAPTDAGRDFAKLSNPILDDDRTADLPLSSGERQFYLEHLSNHRRSELEAMQYLASKIRSGDNRPTALTDAVAKLDPSWSNNQASTIRTGLISRMNELGFIERERVGQRGVKYRLTVQEKEMLRPLESEQNYPNSLS